MMEQFTKDPNNPHRTSTLGATGDPKGEAGASKPGLSNISPVAQFYEGAVMEKGAARYGAYNWADHPMKASTYYNAILRHLSQWWLGENIDLESGLPHMAHLRSSTGIILDQQAADRMIDDRPKHLAKLAPVFQQIEKAKHPLKGFREDLTEIPKDAQVRYSGSFSPPTPSKIEEMKKQESEALEAFSDDPPAPPEPSKTTGPTLEEVLKRQKNFETTRFKYD